MRIIRGWLAFLLVLGILACPIVARAGIGDEPEPIKPRWADCDLNDAVCLCLASPQLCGIRDSADPFTAVDERGNVMLRNEYGDVYMSGAEPLPDGLTRQCNATDCEDRVDDLCRKYHNGARVEESAMEEGGDCVGTCQRINGENAVIIIKQCRVPAPPVV